MTCPDCGQPTITTHAGVHLYPQKSIVGRHLPDDTEVTADDLRQGVRGHVLHTCPPAARRDTTSEQQQLF